MRFLLLCVFCCAPCVAEASDLWQLNRDLADVALAVALIDAPDDGPAPPSPKPPRKDCPDCKGTGRVRSGDGLAWADCLNCEPPSQPPEEVNRIICDCQTTGLCYCGENCPCAGPRKRVAYLYSTTWCVNCPAAKEAIKKAAVDGRLPADMRVIVRESKDESDKATVPPWVKSVPMFHYPRGGGWESIDKGADAFLFAVNYPVAPVSSAPVQTVAAPVYGSACASGACGVSQGQPMQFYQGGWAWFSGNAYSGQVYSGGACANGRCGR